MKLTIVNNKSGLESLVKSLDDTKSLRLPIFYFGDTFTLEVEAGNGFGGYADFTGRADVELNAGLGLPASRTLYTSTNLTYESDGFYTGVLEVDSTALQQAINGQESIKAFFELNASYYGGDKATLLQMPVTINNQLIT